MASEQDVPRTVVQWGPPRTGSSLQFQMLCVLMLLRYPRENVSCAYLGNVIIVYSSPLASRLASSRKSRAGESGDCAGRGGQSKQRSVEPWFICQSDERSRRRCASSSQR